MVRLRELHTAPLLWGLRADTINQKNVIIRLNTPRLHEHTHIETTLYVNITIMYEHMWCTNTLCVWAGWMGCRGLWRDWVCCLSKMLWGLFSSSERLLNKSQFVTVAESSGGHWYTLIQISQRSQPSVRKPVVLSVKSNVWLSPFGQIYFCWRVHMSVFKSTHLSVSAFVFFFRVNHSHSLLFSQAVAKNKYKDSVH